ncbi:MAG: hypothetical protein ACYDAK_09450 [Candidatus Limnocylindrales bacterium]
MNVRRTTIAAGLALIVASFVIYLLSSRQFNAGRGDFFYLADAFLHGRTWLPFALGENDVIYGGAGRFFVPFAPFPAIALMPLVAVVGSTTADSWQPIVNSLIAATDVGLAFWLASRVGVVRVVDRLWLAVLLGFSTAIWWVTTRGGVWHTGHLVATFLTLCALIELFGRRRPWLLGLLGGAAFLTRPPLAFALPVYALLLWAPDDGEVAPDDGDVAPAEGGVKPGANLAPWDPRSWPIREWLVFSLGALPSLAFFFWYNDARFGSPFESGYTLATLPPFLETLREQGLFSTSHVGMNIDYLFLHLPTQIPRFPFFRPDGLGMSIFLTSPGLLLAVRAPWRSRLAVGLGLAALLVLIPTLLYYGGGWLQYGYRYALDSIPFVLALCALAVARHGLGWGWRTVIAVGILVNLGGVYWAYHL